MAIIFNAKCRSVLCDWEGTFHYDCEKYICDLAPDKLTIKKKQAKSKVQVMEKVIKCKKIKRHNFDSKVNGENPMWL